MNTDEIKKMLESELDGKRFLHSLGVAEEAAYLAKLFGADEDKAYLAGLVHDCAKNFRYDEAVEYAKEHGEELDDVTLSCPGIVHAPVGAAAAEEKYGITDTEVLNAVRFHTVACVNMTKLEKIVYIADMTEPNRDFNGVGEIRELSRTDLDAAFLKTLGRSIVYNIEKGNTVHPNTLCAWNEICMKNKQKEEKV